MLGSLVLLIHPDAVTRAIFVEQLGAEFRWIVAPRGADVPTSFDEAPSVVLGDADGVPDLDAICARLRAELRSVRSVALARDDRRRQLPSVDVVLVKPVPIDRLRQALLREARLCKRISGPRPVVAARRPAVDDQESDPDDVVTRRLKY